ncbi:2-amino-4-hydroxy-6-hydroxymethyldihydropteridine diphosphokinase [Candidatus Omnitrophota bacterium]
MPNCYIALGSNLGDRLKNIEFALKYLRADPAIEVRRISSFKETEPQDCPPQQKFLNGVVELETNYPPEQLLLRLQEIETKLGRKVRRRKNQPRTIDLDILIYGRREINQADLQIPHPRMWQRQFVTEPLREIAPELFTGEK